MIGGKQLTVQMASGANKTLTVVQPSQISGVGKIMRLPSNPAIGNNAEQPKLMVVQRPKQAITQPTATLGMKLNSNIYAKLINLLFNL